MEDIKSKREKWKINKEIRELNWMRENGREGDIKVKREQMREKIGWENKIYEKRKWREWNEKVRWPGNWDEQKC